MMILCLAHCVKFSADISDIFLIFPRKQDLAFHAVKSGFIHIKEMSGKSKFFQCQGSVREY